MLTLNRSCGVLLWYRIIHEGKERNITFYWCQKFTDCAIGPGAFHLHYYSRPFTEVNCTVRRLSFVFNRLPSPLLCTSLIPVAPLSQVSIIGLKSSRLSLKGYCVQVEVACPECRPVLHFSCIIIVTQSLM